MKKEEREQSAFLCLCGDRDLKILTGLERMTFGDFNRLEYLTDFLGFERLNTELWRQFAPYFTEKFQKQIELCMEWEEGLDFSELEEEIRKQELWVKEFCRNVPNQRQRKRVERMVSRERKVY